MTVTNVIEYVRIKMYKDVNKIGGDDSEVEEEDSNELNKETDNQSNNNDYVDNNSVDTEQGEKNDEEATITTPNKAASKPLSTNNIPNNWFFPGFMSFVIYGQFADANNRLACFETSNGNTESDKSKAAKRKMEISEKETIV